MGSCSVLRESKGDFQMNVTEAKYNTLGLLGFTGPMPERELQWLQSGGATSDDIRMAWKESLEIYAGGPIPNYQWNTAWYAFLGTLGLTGSLVEREYKFWLGQGVAPPDVAWEDVTFLLNADYVDGTTSFTDDSSVGNTVTTKSPVEVDTAVSKFGNGSALFSGGACALEIPQSNIDPSGAFTIEGWMYPTNLNGGTNAIVGSRPLAGSSYGMTLRMQGTYALRFFMYKGPSDEGLSVVSANNVFVLNTWQHWMLVRDADGVWYVFIDGVQVITGTETGVLDPGDPPQPLKFGNSSGNGFEGNMEEIRVSNGVAVEVENFTPPDEAFPRG